MHLLCIWTLADFDLKNKTKLREQENGDVPPVLNKKLGEEVGEAEVICNIWLNIFSALSTKVSALLRT